jgi:hypothetical protein
MSGVASTSGIGDVTPSRSIALTGQVITCEQGYFDDQRGQAFFAEQGSLSPGITMAALTGQAITVGQGSVTPEQTTGDITVHISGVEADFEQGAFIACQVLTGSSSTSAAGTVVPSNEKSLTGSAITSSAGTVVPNLAAEDTYIASAATSPTCGTSLPLTGSAVTVAQGSVSASAADKTASLVAFLSIHSGHGTLPGVISVALSGHASTFAQSNVGAPGFADLTGSSVSVGQGFLGKALAISGQEITSSQGDVEGVPGLVALVGESTTVEQGTLSSSGTDWDRPPEPSTTWVPTSNPNSAWVRKDGPSTSWNRK